MDTKVCSQCGMEKPVTEFSRDNRAKDRIKYKAACRACIRAKSRRRDLEHRVEENARKRKWHEEHPDYIKQWYAEHREYMREHDREYHALHREERNAQSHAYYLANRTGRLAKQRQYYLEHKEERDTYAARRRQEHKEEIRATIDAWRRRNPEMVKTQSNRRRARKAQAEGSYTAEDWLAILDKYGHKCLKCGTTENITVDHIIPLSKGGTNYPDNLQPLCAHCNSSKKTRYADYRPDSVWGFT